MRIRREDAIQTLERTLVDRIGVRDHQLFKLDAVGNLLVAEHGYLPVPSTSMSPGPQNARIDVNWPASLKVITSMTRITASPSGIFSSTSNAIAAELPCEPRMGAASRSEEPTYELQYIMRISYAGFFLKKKKKTNDTS